MQLSVVVLMDLDVVRMLSRLFFPRIFEAVEVQRAKAMIREQVEKVVISWDMDLLGHAPRYPCIDWSHDRLVWSGPLVRRPVGEEERS